MRLALISLSIAVVTLSVAHAETAGTARHVGLLHFLTKSAPAKQPAPEAVLPGTGVATPAVPAEPVAAAPQPAEPVVAPQQPNTVKKAAKAKPVKAAKRKSKKLAKKRTPKPVEPDIAQAESEQSGRASLVSVPVVEEQSAMATPAAEPEIGSPTIGSDDGTSLGKMIAYKARLAEGNLDGALAALSQAVNTEPDLTMIARLNETIGVSLDAAQAKAMVDKVAVPSQTAAPPPSAPAEARIQAAHGLAADVGSQTIVNALADYKKAVLANDIPAATFALTGFLGHPIDSESVRQTNALLGLPADPSAEQALATTAR